MTGYWPGEEPTRLPAAPVSDGVVCTPRQVSADVPSAIDSVIIRALLQRPTRHGSADPVARGVRRRARRGVTARAASRTSSPGARRLPGPGRLRRIRRRIRSRPEQPGLLGGTRAKRHRALPVAAAAVPRGGVRGSAVHRTQYAAPGYQGGKRGVSRVMVTVVVVLVLVVVAVLVWAVGFRKPRRRRRAAAAAADRTRRQRRPAARCSSPCRTAHSTSTGSGQRGPADGGERDRWLGRARSGRTDYYQNHPNFGDLKPGTGLLIDMGKKVQLSQVEVIVRHDLLHDRGRSTSATPRRCPRRRCSNFTLVAPRPPARGPHVLRFQRQGHRAVRADLATSLPQPARRPGRSPGSTRAGSTTSWCAADAGSGNS